MQANGKKPKNGKKMIVWGYVLVVLALLYIVLGVVGQLETKNPVATVLQMLLVFGGGGAILLYLGYKRKSTLDIQNKIIKLVEIQKQTGIDAIANAVGLPQNKLTTVLNKMLEMGHFPGAYIDEKLRELVLPKTTQEQMAGGTQTAILKCPNCGASNTVVGNVSECEYCGSPIKQADSFFSEPTTPSVTHEPSGVIAEVKSWLKKILK